METAVSQDGWSEAKPSCAGALGTLRQLRDEMWECPAVSGAAAVLCTAGWCVTMRSQPPLPHATIGTSPANGIAGRAGCTWAGCSCACTQHWAGCSWAGCSWAGCACACTGAQAALRQSRWVGSSRRCSELPGTAGMQGTRPAGQLRVLWRDTLGKRCSQPLYFTLAVWRARPLHHEGPSPSPIFCLYAHHIATAFAG